MEKKIVQSFADSTIVISRQVSLIEETPQEGGLWRNVLYFIRLNLNLKWFSLRGIRYNDDLLAMGGMPFGNTIYGPPPPGDSDSSDDDYNIDTYSKSSSSSSDTGDEMAGRQASTEDSDDETVSLNGEESIVDEDDRSDISDSDSTTVAISTDDDQEDSTNDSHEELDDGLSDLDETHNLRAEDVNTTAVIRPKPSGASCYCDSGFAFENFGNDNGRYVLKQQWKRWELWAGKRRCQIGHDPVPDST